MVITLVTGHKLDEVIDRWNEIDEIDPLPSINEITRRIGIEPPISTPGDRFERDQTDIVMYWPAVLA